MTEDRPALPRTGETDQVALLAAAVDQVAVGLMVVTKDLQVAVWNQWMADSSGIVAEDAVGKTLGDLFPGANMRAVRRKVHQVLMLGNQAFFDARTHGALFPLRRASPLRDTQKWIQQSCTLSRLESKDGESLVCISVTDQTAAVTAEAELRQANRELQLAARIDGLTGLLNRHTVCLGLDHEVMRSERTGAELSIVLFDIDFFKRVNDTWGHLAGDVVLRGMGDAVRICARVTDQIGRYGGEEFLVVLTDTDSKGADLTARRLQAAVRSLEIQWEGEPIPVTASFGVATWRSGEHVEALLARADIALYAAKRSGRDCIRHTP